jgi:formate hydrogenlyase transcriptional activator
VTAKAKNIEKLPFEELLFQLSAKFINLPTDRIDDEINNGLKLISESLSIDRIALLQFSEDKKQFHLTHGFAVNSKEIPPNFLVSAKLPWFTGSIKKGKILRISKIDDLPKEAFPEREYSKKQGFKAFVTIPLKVSDSVIGGISYTDMTNERTWQDHTVQRLTLVNEIFASTLGRQHTEKKLTNAYLEIKEQLQFEKLISSLSSEFISLSPDLIDQKIINSLRLISESVHIQRITLHQFSKDKKQLYLTHSYVEDPTQRIPKFLVSEKLPWFSESIKKGKIQRISKIDDLPEMAASEKQYAKKHGIKAFIIIPLRISGLIIGAIAYSNLIKERSWSNNIVQRFTLVNEIFANALERKQNDHALNKAYCDIKELQEKLQNENLYLREEIEVRQSHKKIIGQSDPIMHVLSQIEKVAPQDTNVLILGETGTGKELVADEIHSLSSRRKQLMVKVNCGALPPTLIESELFGREKGAYTGAVARQIGRFEAAHNSTLFLDEIAELPPELQIKLLRVLQEGKFERLGSTKTISVDVRIISATNQDLQNALNKGKFRQDLYYRLNVFPITVPPLRDRREDIPLIVWHFVREFEKAMGKKIESITERSMKLFLNYLWPGNIREIRNIIERSMILGTGSVLKVNPLLFDPENVITKTNGTLEELMRNHILDALDRCNWQVGGINGAAQVLGLNRTTLISKMKKLQIKRS